MKTIEIFSQAGQFAEDKDVAKKIRQESLVPALSQGDSVVVDFSKTETATQSFIHALLSEVIRENGEAVLDRISFKDCSKKIQSVVKTVVQYTLESVDEASETTASVVKDSPTKKK